MRSQRNEELKSSQQRLKENQKNFLIFLKRNLNDFDEYAIYDILESHGRYSEMLIFAEMKENYEIIVDFRINEDNYNNAINFLAKLPLEKMKKLVAKYSSILMQEETCNFTSHILTFFSKLYFISGGKSSLIQSKIHVQPPIQCTVRTQENNNRFH